MKRSSWANIERIYSEYDNENSFCSILNSKKDKGFQDMVHKYSGITEEMLGEADRAFFEFESQIDEDGNKIDRSQDFMNHKEDAESELKIPLGRR